MPAAQPKSLSSAIPKAAVALGLTFAAGYVDVVGYLGLFHVFTANMTGNTVHLANRLTGGRWADAALAGFVIAAFLVGSVLGRTIIEVGARKGIRRISSITLLIEAGLLVAVILASTRAPSAAGATWMIVVLAAAMGLQTATLTRVGPLTVHTTFVTGMLNKLAQLLAHTAFLSYDLLRGREYARQPRRRSLRRAVFIFSIWVLYFIGALAGIQMHHAIGFPSLAVPTAVMGAAIVVDQAHPLSLREERDEMETGK